MLKFKQRTSVLQSNYNICSLGTVCLQVTERVLDNAATETTARVDINKQCTLVSSGCTHWTVALSWQHHTTLELESLPPSYILYCGHRSRILYVVIRINTLALKPCFATDIGVVRIYNTLRRFYYRYSDHIYRPNYIVWGVNISHRS